MLKAIICCLMLALLIPPCMAKASGQDEREPTTVLFLNCGKADAILIKTEGRAYLVDSGYERTSDKLLEMLECEGVKKLDGVFLTHAHKDHYGGLTALADSSVTIDAFYASGFCADGTGKKHPMVRAAARRGQKPVFLYGGDSVVISPSARFDVLAPVTLNKDNENNNSLVMSLTTPDGTVLLTGDMKNEEEYLLVRSGLLSRHDVLKVPFHGDNTACSTAFLNAVLPRAAIISTSTKEEKDTPSKETLYRLAGVGAKTYVTQDAGDAIRVTLAQGSVTVEMETWE